MTVGDAFARAAPLCDTRRVNADSGPAQVPPRVSHAPGVSNRELLRWGVRVWLAGAVFFLIMAGFAAVYDRFPGDEAVADALQDIDVPVLGGYVEFVNLLGAAWVYIPLTIILTVALGVMRAGWESLLVLYSVGARGANSVLKELVERPRPSDDLVNVSETAHGFGFPSGHAVGAAALFAVLFLVLPTVVKWRPARWLLQAACVLAIVSAGPARVYAGVHWPSDVIAGYFLALLAVGPPLIAYLRLR